MAEATSRHGAIGLALRAQQGLRALFAVCVLLLLASCDRPQQIHLIHGATMGTTWSVKVVDLPKGVTLPALRQDIELVLESINRQMSTYRPDSDISRYNQAAADSWQALSPDFWRVVRYSLTLAADTGGAFDPTVGPLVNLWGFGPERGPGTLPEAALLEAALARVGWQRVGVNEPDQAIHQPGDVYLDLSATAKGYAVDKVMELLNGRGVKNALVEIGGDLRGSGAKPDGQPWRIAVERPLPGVREIAHVLNVRDAAVATSGDYRNYVVDGQSRRSHLIDPRTGSPIGHGVVSVTVIHPRCLEADGLATALSILAPAEGLAYAEKRKLAVLLMVQTEEGLEERMTPAFRAYLAEESAP
ncbi:MAG: FAD:protein FMN transferase [Alcanivoracaceae bacterium]